MQTVEQKRQADERRSLGRLKPYYYLRVYDAETELYLGSVIDISLKGMRLVSDTAFETGSKSTFKMHLPEDGFFGESVEVSAKCRWSKSTADNDGFESGFEFSATAGAGVLTIRSLIADLKSKNAM